MRKQTDLAKVKQTALALLSTEINETPYSPMIVKHPFTDTGVSAIPDGKGGVDMIDLTEDDAQLKWRQSMARQIDKADNAYAIYMMVTKPYALTFLKFAMPHLSREDMSQILASAWTRSEAPHQDVNVTVNQLLRMFKQADPTCLMEQDEYIQFKTLDDMPVKVIPNRYPLLRVQRSIIPFTSPNTRVRTLCFVKHPLVRQQPHRYLIG